MAISVRARDLDADYARERLLTHYLREGKTVYTVLRSVSASGMTRQISLLVADGDEITDITYLTAALLGENLYETNGSRSIRVNGCGMDTGFHLVYSLASVLFAGQDRAGYLLNHRWA
jgi:hypothetical protein